MKFNVNSLNKEVSVRLGKRVESLPIPIDFDGKNMLLMNNYIDHKNKLHQKISLIDLESRESIDVNTKIRKIQRGSIVDKGFAMVQENTNVILFNLFGKNLRLIKGYDSAEKEYFAEDLAVRMEHSEIEDDLNKPNSGRFDF